MDANATHTGHAKSAYGDTNKLYEFVELLRVIDSNAPLARINETTISDNNGGRIQL